MHSLTQQHPALLDTRVSNPDWRFGPGDQRGAPHTAGTFIPLPTQLCDYAAVLNVGNNADWAERLRQLFYGNAVVMVPEWTAHEFFNEHMVAYRNFWPIQADLSDVLQQARRVLSLKNRSKMLQRQRRFAETYLSECFMLQYNAAVMRAYHRHAAGLRKDERKWPMEIR